MVWQQKQIRLLTTVLYVLFLILCTLSTMADSSLPQNFEKTKIASGLANPTGFAIAPDERIFILEKTGTVKIIKKGEVLPQPFVVLPANSDAERGLLGIAFDPDFLNNSYVYFFYTHNASLSNRISRLTANGDVAIDGSETVLFQTNEPLNLQHQGATLRFSTDSMLWVSTGNNIDNAASQSLNSVFGKVLRITKNGSIPADNPFVGTPGARGEIWAYGFRNPFRFNVLPTGEPILGDVGEVTWEEINVIKKGANYGWPNAEGLCTDCPYTNPVFTYNHFNASAAVVGGLVYTGTAFPQEYLGTYFYGDFAQGKIRRLLFDDSYGSVIGDYDFDNKSGTVVDFAQDSSGDLYYLTIFPGELYKIHYALGNHAPIAQASASAIAGLVPLTIQFSSEGSYDQDANTTLSYFWNFSDGTIATEPNPVHTYTANGVYTVNFSVSDGSLQSRNVMIPIVVGDSPPVPTIILPLQNTTYNAGDTIHFKGVAADAEDGTLSADAFTWTILLHHQTHVHPFFGPTTNITEGDIIIPNIGEPSPETWHEFILSARDARGVVTTVSQTITPNKVNITFATDPPGLKIIVDGIPSQGFTTEAVSGFHKILDTYPVQSLDGIAFIFRNWSNTDAQTQTIIVDHNDTTFTAHFVPYNPNIPPANVSLQINDGNSSTASDLIVLTIHADNAESCRFVNQNDSGGQNYFSDYQTFTPRKIWNLSTGVDYHTGLRTVTVQCKNVNGSLSSYDQIVFNPPQSITNFDMTINNGNTTTNSEMVALSLAANNADQCRFVNQNDFGGQNYFSDYQPVASQKMWNLSAGVDYHEGLRTVTYQCKNNLGSVSLYRQITLKTQKLIANLSMTINGGNLTTRTETVTLSLIANNADQCRYINQNDFGGSNYFSPYESFLSNKLLNLSAGVGFHSGLRTITYECKNSVGAASQYSQIVFNPPAPIANLSIIMNGNNASTNSEMVALSLRADNADQCRFVNQNDFGGSNYFSPFESFSPMRLWNLSTGVGYHTGLRTVTYHCKNTVSSLSSYDQIVLITS